MTKDKGFDPGSVWDVVTSTTSGEIVWRNYSSPPRIVIAKRGENPNDMAPAEVEHNSRTQKCDQDTR